MPGLGGKENRSPHSRPLGTRRGEEETPTAYKDPGGRGALSAKSTEGSRIEEVFRVALAQMVQWLKLLAASAGALGSIPAKGARSCKPQLKVLNATLRPGTDK